MDRPQVAQRGPYDEIQRPDGKLAYRDVRIDADIVRKRWRPETPAIRTARQKLEVENACRAAIIERMRKAPNDPVPKATLKRDFPTISKRMFDGLYAEASRESGCGAWSRGGRRRRKPN